jgi:hypothetical protein
MHYPVDKDQRDGHGDEARGECEEGHEQAPADAHPSARSTTVTLNGWAPGGSMSNVSPQCPTITSAGASRP